MKLSDILEYVAAEYEKGELSGYSCGRVCEQINLCASRDDIYYQMIDSFTEGVHNMGLDCESRDAFDDTLNQQQARTLWLTWCAMMAREQGL